MMPSDASASHYESDIESDVARHQLKREETMDPPLSLNDYIKSRSRQEDLLSREIHSIREGIDLVKTEVGEVKNDVKSQCALVERVFARIDNHFAHYDQLLASTRQRVEETDVRSRRMDARIANKELRNPNFPMVPFPTYQLGHGIIEPDLSLIPKTPRQLYRLRTPTTDRRRNILTYLIGCYDVPYKTWLASDDDDDHRSDDDDDDDDNDDHISPDISIDDAINNHPYRIVEYLAGIFGLNVEHFDMVENAKHRQRSSPVKRRHATNFQETDDEGDIERRKRQKSPRKLEIRQNDMKSDATEDVQSNSTKLGYNYDTSPSINQKLRRIYHPVKSVDSGNSIESGTPTNPNPSIRL